jgi:hypothetical protein
MRDAAESLRLEYQAASRLSIDRRSLALGVVSSTQVTAATDASVVRHSGVFSGGADLRIASLA